MACWAVVGISLVAFMKGCSRVHAWCFWAITCVKSTVSFWRESRVKGSLPFRETDLILVFIDAACICSIIHIFRNIERLLDCLDSASRVRLNL